MSTPNILICGHGRHGKDSVAAFLHNGTTLKYTGSLSWFALPEMAEFLKQPPQLAWENRHQHRQLWFDKLNELRAGDPLFLIRRALRVGNVVTGVRSREEIDGVKASGLFDSIVWVTRRGFPTDPTVCFTEEDCTDVIVNDGSLEDLKDATFDFARRKKYL